MKLNTQIIAQQTHNLITSLHCSFDHQFTVLPSQFKTNQIQTSNRPLSFTHQIIQEYLTHENQQHQPKCIMTYNINFKELDLNSIVQKCGQTWKITVFQYNPKIGTFKQTKISLQNQIEYQPTQNNYTYYIQLLPINKNTILRCYFLPTITNTTHNDNYHSLHQSFKLIRAIKDYVSLDIHAEQTLIFDDPICSNLSEFLYQNDINNIKILLNFQGNDIDKIVQQKVGEIRLPQPWLQKRQYRQKKKQIYCLHRDDRTLVKKIKKMKTEIVNTLNSLQSLMGLELQKYENVSIDTLKKIKATAINDKVALIKQLSNLSLGLDKRQKELQKLKQESLLKKNELQKNQIKELIKIKKQVLTLQAEQPTPKYSGTQHFIYTRNKQSTIQNKLIKTIFTRTNKKEKDFIEQNQNWKQCQNHNRLSNQNSSHRIRYEKQKQKEKLNTNQFKCAEKRVANVIKQGNKNNQQLDIKKVREQYQNQILAIDFEMEKKLQQKQLKYQKASNTLRRLLEQSQDINFQHN